MIDMEQQRAFETTVADFGSIAITAQAIEDLSRRAMAGDANAATNVAAALVRVAAIDPGASMAVLDAVTRGCLGADAAPLITPPDQSAMLEGLSERGKLTNKFWLPFWEFINPTAPTERGGDEVTALVAALCNNVDESFSARAEAASLAHSGRADAANREVPPKLTLEALAALPDGSLGNDLYRLIVDNNFNLEVLEREGSQLQNAPPALRYLNFRILQMHDVWHLVAGYRTTVLQEVAISAFSLAQFNHNYSAMLIATTIVASLKNSVGAAGFAIQVIAEGWLHGRTMPSFMAIEWEDEWHLPMAEIRARHGITPFVSAFPADLIEQMRQVA